MRVFKSRKIFFLICFYLFTVFLFWRFPSFPAGYEYAHRFPNDIKSFRDFRWILERYGNVTFVINNNRGGNSSFSEIYFKNTDITCDEIKSYLINIEFKILILEDVQISNNDLLNLLKENKNIESIKIIKQQNVIVEASKDDFKLRNDFILFVESLLETT